MRDEYDDNLFVKYDDIINIYENSNVDAILESFFERNQINERNKINTNYYEYQRISKEIIDLIYDFRIGLTLLDHRRFKILSGAVSHNFQAPDTEKWSRKWYLIHVWRCPEEEEEEN